MIDFAALIAQMDEQRALWLDLAKLLPGKRLRYLRPLETDVDRLRGTHLRDLAEALAEFVTDWTGYTEADFLGNSQGSDAPVPFNRALFVRWVRDRMDVVAELGSAIRGAVEAHRQAKDAAAKN